MGADSRSVGLGPGCCTSNKAAGAAGATAPHPALSSTGRTREVARAGGQLLGLCGQTSGASPLTVGPPDSHPWAALKEPGLRLGYRPGRHT